MQNIRLYPYQDNAVHNAITMLGERGNSLIVAGTGAGKTIMMAAAIGRFFYGFYAEHRRKPHVLVLVHRTEIHDQNHTKFSRVCPELSTSEITASRKSLHGNVHFGMVQTVANLLDEFSRANSYFDLIVIDEAHHSKASTYESIINWNMQGKPEMCLLGVTATPNRGDKLPLIHLFDNYIQITTKFLIDSHYLVRPRFVDVSPMFQTDKGLEYGHLSRNCRMDIEGQALIKSLCKIYLQNKEEGKSIIFAPSHEFCSEIVKALKSLGRKPAYLALGLEDTERRNQLDLFEKGDCDELVNVDICTEGYDFPELRNVVEFDTNGTHGQWVQKVGRVLRTAPGKSTCSVIDFGGNIQLYPDGVETDVDLDGVVKKPRGSKLCEKDFFPEKEERRTFEHFIQNAEAYTPYSPPKGFETVLDTDAGIVFTACGEKRDCIIIPDGDNFLAHLGDKNKIIQKQRGTFDQCVKYGMGWVGEIADPPPRPMSRLQIQLLAPDYATTAMDWYGANCCICWKTWKGEILGVSI